MVKTSPGKNDISYSALRELYVVDMKNSDETNDIPCHQNSITVGQPGFLKFNDNLAANVCTDVCCRKIIRLQGRTITVIIIPIWAIAQNWLHLQRNLLVPSLTIPSDEK